MAFSSGAADVTRKGAPKVTGYEATVRGDSATVVACLDERDWTFFADGQRLKAPPMKPGSVGATLEKRKDGWIMIGVLGPGELARPAAERACLLTT